MTIPKRHAVVPKRKKYAVLALCFYLAILSGCGGGMVNAKQAFDADPKIVVAEFPNDQLGIGLVVPGRENSKGARGLARCSSVVNCLVESRSMPAEYSNIAEAVADEVRIGFGKPGIKSSKGMNVPMKKNTIGPETPDWGKTEFELVIQPSIDVKYTEAISSTSTAPFTYSLDGAVTVSIRRKGAKGNWETIKPNMFGYVQIASVSKKLAVASSTYKTIEELQAVLPPSAIADELREKTREGMKKFIAEIMAAK